MKKEMNNKGFSLVELIIVIAIMAVLVGILAPQYLKYVNNSKVNTDITNAQSIATAFNVAFADGLIDANDDVTGGTGACPSAIGSMDTYPVSKYDSTYKWDITLGDNGVDEIKLGGKVIYPNPDKDSSSYGSLRK